MDKAQTSTGLFGCALCPGSVPENARVAILGIPFEAGSQRPGVEGGPDGIRKAAQRQRMAAQPSFYDLGNVANEAEWPTAVGALTELDTTKTTPVLLGGGIEVADRALARWQDHSVIAVTHKLRPDLARSNVLWLGLNGPQPAEFWESAQVAGQQCWSARQIDEGAEPNWPATAILWIDAAVFDTGQAAGADEYNPGGAKPESIDNLLKGWTGKVQAIIVTGTAPTRDPRGLTETTIASILAEKLSHA